MSSPAPAALSPLDTERFGVTAARAAAVTLENLPQVLEFCRQNQVLFLVARCPAEDMPAAQALEEAGFRLMDTLVYYDLDLGKADLPGKVASLVKVREAQAADAGVLEEIARQAFQRFPGHYHADPRLDQDICTEVYASWAGRACRLPEVANRVLLAEVNGSAAGFAALRLNQPEVCEIVLNAVHPALQRQGIYSALLVHAAQASRDLGAAHLIISTPLPNLPVQRIWCRFGFVPTRAYYTFHRWFD